MTDIDDPKSEYTYDDIFSIACATVEKTIWRYMDFAKFVSMLASGELYFASVATLQTIDKWETVYPENFLLAHEKGSINRPGGVRDSRQETLDRSFINCWHVNEYESAAMWKLYSSGAYTVAIRSTVGKLKDAFKSKDILVQVNWVDYIEFNRDERKWNNLMLPMFTKRIHFKHENELRVVRELRERPTEQVAGIGIPVDLSGLFEAVYVSPYDPPWFEGVVKNLLEKCGFNPSLVTPSVLNEEPVSIAPLPPSPQNELNVPEGMNLEFVWKKLRETEFFLRKIDERARLVSGDHEEFDFYLSAFLNAARTVDYRIGFAGERLHDKPSQKKWRDGWTTSLKAQDAELMKALSGDRDLEVHEDGSRREKTDEFIPVSGTYRDASCEITITGPIDDTTSGIIRPRYYFVIGGKQVDAIEVCRRYVTLLQQLVRDFAADHP